MKKKIIIGLAVLGILAAGTTVLYAARPEVCPRCKCTTNPNMYKCPECGIIYCTQCSQTSDKELAEGKKPSGGAVSTRCPSCGNFNCKILY